MPTASVVVLTGDRLDLVRTCLEHLTALRPGPDELIVVDTSEDDRTALLVSAEFPDVTVAAIESGPHARRRARQRGIELARGEVVAFVDDDVRTDETWLAELLRPYADPAVVGVGGRVVANSEAGDDEEAIAIGRLLPDGRLTDQFGRDPGRDLVVEHLPEPTASFRRAALDAVGGFRPGFPGTETRAVADLCFRLTRTGGTLVFTPRAVARHEPGKSQVGGRRYVRRTYLYWLRRNHLELLIRHGGLADPRVWRYARTVVRGRSAHWAAVRFLAESRPASGRLGRGWAWVRGFLTAVVRWPAELAGVAVGVGVGCRARLQDRAAGRR